MKGSWQRWLAAGLLAGGLLGVGCINKNEGENTGAFKTPTQEKYQPRAAGEASRPNEEWQGHPSPQQDARSSSGVGAHTRLSMLRGDVIRQRLREGPAGEGRMGAPELWLGSGLGTGLAESYDTGQGGSGQGHPVDSGSQAPQP